MRVERKGWAWVVLTALVCAGCSSPATENTESLNRLAKASSPYLREHADNPVDWYEWGDEALTKATSEGKPLIISIGYASCHWCHVMEEESFMDTTVARIMNENFVAIKIDREERPDVDQVYIDAAQLISGRAGWPLNAFALPNGKPFYAGTYFPKDQWINLLNQITEAYKSDRLNVDKQAAAVTEGILENNMIASTESEANTELLQTYQGIFPGWEPDLDYSFGGLAGAPKFPMPVVWEFLLQEHRQNNNERALKVVSTTLDAMAAGGIYDHLAGGFARYSTDAEWRVPHFEKMLYDNGQLVSLYAHAYQLTKNEAYARVVEETLSFVSDELTSPQSGFYSSLNADSEGEEGTFYVWTKAEIEALLDAKSAELFCDYYGISAEGNWEHGKNVLYRQTGLSELATEYALTEDAATTSIEKSRKRLLATRNKRIRPSLDDKILTSWNALMLSGYIDAYWAFGKPEYLAVALKNADFLKKNMIRSDGGLWRSYTNGGPSIEAFLDDYAFLSLAFIQLYQATFDIRWLEQARSLADYAVAHFHDTSTGFFYYTSNTSEQLVARKFEIADQVIPSSNAAMAEALFKLGHYYESATNLDMSKKMVGSLSKDFTQSGPYFAKWASSMGLLVNEPFEVAVMGPDALEKSQLLMREYHPGMMLMGGDSENLPLLENKLVEGETIIYVCQNKVCKLPVKSVEQALKQLSDN
ncbi:MAG: thioredoxin domain-containing protein [Imperialibacter sp.]|uniref:thioredoxin domain-containing protein n=1 Tax=Imperialibacter sp. TaxID=2038411 RepID=UPI003A85E046